MDNHTIFNACVRRMFGFGIHFRCRCPMILVLFGHVAVVDTNKRLEGLLHMERFFPIGCMALAPFVISHMQCDRNTLLYAIINHLFAFMNSRAKTFI